MRTGKTEQAGLKIENHSPAKLEQKLWLLIPVLWAASVVALYPFLIGKKESVFTVGLLLAAETVLAFLAAVFIFKHSRSIKNLQQRADQLQTFCEAIKVAASTLELQELMDAAARIIVEVTGVKGCSISLLDPKSAKMQVKSLVGIERDFDISTSIYQKGLLAGEPLVVRDVALREFPEVDERMESLICVPLRLEEKVLGAICIYGERGQRLSLEMISILSSLANVVSLAIAHAFLYEDQKNLVNTKVRFMLQTSHELCSPLSTIQSIARTLLQGYLGKLNEKQKEMISRIDIRARILFETVSDLLTLAKGRAELPTLKLKSLNLAAIITECARFFEIPIEEKKIRFELSLLEEEAIVLATEEGLRSIVTNLISNAIKYTPEGGRVVVRAFLEKGMVVLTISDSGIGIPRHELEKLFNEFFRASNAKTLTESGTGLGLAIVKAYVDQLGGSISVESEELKGTTFRIGFRKGSSR